MRHHWLRNSSLALLAGSALVLTNAVPSSFHGIGTEQAFAKGKDSSKSGGKGGGKSSSTKSSAKGKSGGNGQSAAAYGQSKPSKTTSLASGQVGKPESAATPKSVVRQYVLEAGLKQGDVASMLKSWNSLNRNEQAYLNNMDNPNSLPGRQIAYVRENMEAQAAFDAFAALGGDVASPPPERTEEERLAAQAALDAQNLLDEVAAAPGTYSPEQVIAANAVIADYTGDDAQTVVDEYNLYTAFTDFEDAEAGAESAFMAASVSYNTDVGDETIGDLRELVDKIVVLKGLNTLVTEFDAAATSETTEPEMPAAE